MEIKDNVRVCVVSRILQLALTLILGPSLECNYYVNCVRIAHWAAGSLRFRTVLRGRPSRPGRSMVFVQTEKYSRGCWGVWHIFIHGWATMHAASCVSVCVSHVGAPAPQRGTHSDTCPLACLSSSPPPAGSPYLLKYQRGTKPENCQNLTEHNIILGLQAHFMLWEQLIGPRLKAKGTLVIRPPKAMGTLVPSATQTPGRGSQTASAYPTIHPFWVPHLTIYARMSSTRFLGEVGRAPHP